MGQSMKYQEQIDKSHPTVARDNKHYKAHSIAMELIHERYQKHELVDLVTWLIVDNAKTVENDL